MKICVLFPGIGYTNDRPLLYYSGKIASSLGYTVIRSDYTGFPKDVKSSLKSVEAAHDIALSQAEEILKGTDFKGAEDILFISKSIGTVVAAGYAEKHGLMTRNVYYTPVAATFRFHLNPGIAFTGTADRWVTLREVTEGCDKAGIPLCVTENANHSLETGSVLQDIEILSGIMEKTSEYLKGPSGI